MTKTCARCKKELPVTDFYIVRKQGAHPRFNSYCKACFKEYRRGKYTARGYYTKYTARRQIERRVWLEEYKTSRGCCTCGEKHPACLEFHHIDPSQKLLSLSSGTLCSFDKVKAEIEKCIIQCSNCHRKHHWDTEKRSKYREPGVFDGIKRKPRVPKPPVTYEEVAARMGQGRGLKPRKPKLA